MTIDLTRDGEPALFAALDQTPLRVVRVELSADARLTSSRAGSALTTLVRRRGMVLHAGLFALRALSVSELQALLGAVEPATTSGLARAQVAWSAYALAIARALHESGHGVRDLFACVALAQALVPPALLEERVSRLRKQRPASTVEGAEGDPRPASALLSDEPGLATRLRPPSDQPLLPAPAELELAAGISLHDDAVELSQLKWPGADAHLLAGVARLERALGQRHPLLVRPLANAARAWLDQGDQGAADEVLVRALGILREQPDPDENEVLRLTRLLDRVRESGGAQASR